MKPCVTRKGLALAVANASHLVCLELEADLRLYPSQRQRPGDGAETGGRRAKTGGIDITVRKELRITNRLVGRADELAGRESD